MSIFVGRQDEQQQFIDWVEHEPPKSDRRAGLVVGPAGMGKSALLQRFERICRERPKPRWWVQRVLLNANESPDAFFERLLVDAHRLFRYKLLKSGPQDRRLLPEMFKSIPGLGALLAALVGNVKRPAWERFIDYSNTLSAALANRGERYVLLIDPHPEMGEGQSDEWVSVAQRLPPAIRVLIAQRPDDVISAHPDSRRLLGRIPADNQLGELDETAVEEWYKNEFAGGRLVEYVNRWSAGVRLRLPRLAFERYGGYPVAHEAVMRLLVTEPVDDPLTEIANWPRELRELLDMLFDRLAACGEERLRAALVLQVFQLPTPLESWAQAAGMTAEGLIAALGDPRFRHFFAEVDTPYGPGHAPFHPLFAERLENELERVPQRREELAETAWKAIEPELDEEKLATSIPREFELHAATAVADRYSDVERLLAATDRVFRVKLRLGALSEAESDLTRVQARMGAHSKATAATLANLAVIRQKCGDLDAAKRMHREAGDMFAKLGEIENLAKVFGNLAVIHQAQGELDAAERMHRKALELHGQLGQIEGVAREHRHLGVICQKRGDLAAAERRHDQALGLYRQLGNLEGTASTYANLGLVHLERDDLEGAERLLLAALDIGQQLGWLEGMAKQYGNLGAVYQRRGDLDSAERMHRRALEINEELARLEGMADQYANLGLVHQQRGDAGPAREYWGKARELFERIGMPHMVEKVQGWIDGLDADES